MKTISAYNVEHVSGHVINELKRLRAQVDLFWDKEYRQLLEFGLIDGMRIVEFGCGPGFMSARLLGNLPEIRLVGVDPDPVMVPEFQKNLDPQALERTRQVCGSIMSADLEENCFDFAITRLVLEHIPDPLAALAKIRRILKPGGRAVFIDNDFGFHLRTFPEIPELAELYDAYCRCRIDEGGNPTIGRELPTLLQAAGFDQVDLELITAHSRLIGDDIFFASEGSGIPLQLVNKGYLSRAAMGSIMQKWRDMVRHDDHIIFRQLFAAVGRKAPESCCMAEATSVPACEHTSSVEILPGAAREQITAIAAGLLQVPAEALPVTEHFIDLGLGSIETVELIERLNKKLGIQLDISAVFDFPSIGELARHISACHQVDRARLNPATADPGKEKAAQAAEPDPEPPPAYLAPYVQAPAACIQAADSRILSEDIAVIGMSGRFASAESVHEYWDLLIGGRNAIKEIDRPGWNPEDFYDSDVSKENKANSKWGGLLGDIRGFDPRFFKIPPREAEFMDPQQRLFLMEGYKALEDSGYTSGMLSDSRTAVFVGVRPSDYLRLAISRGGVNSQSFLGNDNSILASRISYCLNLNGPSLAIDTACSSSLVAMHLACESIRRGESDMALAGGVFVMSSPEFYQLASKTTMLSPNGLCKTFDDAADGIVPGEAVAAVVLKPLDRAVADGDRIYGVIKASAVNQDGKTNGITAPRMISQKELLRRLYRVSGIDPETISFIETHGTGTKLGDPIEFKALAEVFREFTAKTGYCLLGSHKPNIGHSITAAGISGLIKILLSLNHRQIPPFISLDNINRHISLDATPFAVNSQAYTWTSGNDRPLRAGISSFGFNGTNCHMIIEQSPVESGTAKSWNRPGCLVPLSAKNPAALHRRLAELARWMETDGSHQHLSDIAFTLSLKRDHFNHRMIVAAVDTADFKQRLKALVRGARQDESLPSSVPSDFYSVWPEDPTAAAMEHLAGNYISGNPVDWESLYDKTSCRLVGVPAYPFSRQPYWLPEAEDQPKGRSRIVPRQETSGGDPAGEPIAIIGMAAVLPQSRDLETFYAHILAQKSLVTEIPPSRWDWRRYFGDATRQPNKTTVKWGAFVPDVYQFDARFFGISRREAELMDPQQRLLLETVWSCMENAGITATEISGSATGFFLGISNMDYFGMATHPDMPIEAYSSTGTTHSIAANRVSYFLNLHGPNESIDTACSSSLVAAHRAVTSLRRGECEMAFVAGVNVMLNPVLHLSFSRAGMLSTQGQCKTFDESADGYVRGEGAAVILLKPLSRAIEDRDPIHALIRGSAVNHGGWANTLTAPNPKAQTDLIVQAYRNAGVDPATIGYIEAHGTGTSLGDPVEVNGLIAAFKQLYEQWRHPLPEKPVCKIGSVKTMIGHLEAAAGISGLLHVVLAMQHGRLPGNIHLNKVNPYIRLEQSPFSFARNPEPWNRFRAPDNREIPLRAGVSAFGFGGANAHVVLEEYLPATAATVPAPTGSIVVPLSARDQGALRQYARRLADFLISGDTAVDLNDVAYTLQTGREPMAERLAVVARDLPELAQTLQHYAQGRCNLDNLFCGRVKQTRRGKSTGNAQAADRAGLETAVRNGNLAEPARLWVQGGEIPWRVFYNDPGPRRIPLPTYPFQRQTYRIPQVGWVSRSGSRSNPSTDSFAAHPLIDGQRGQIYVKTLHPNEFYLNDHRVGDTPVLPGAAYLEMAREAASRNRNGLPVRAIRDVVWSAPITVNDGAVILQLHLRTEEQHTAFKAVTVSSDGSTRSHAQGRLFFDDVAQGVGRAEMLDIAEIQRRCDDVLTADQCYQVFSCCGLNYGPGFQCIRELRRNSAEALARIELPAHLDTGSRDFGLHPSLLDGLLQTVLGVLQFEAGGETLQYLPFGLADLEIRGPMPRNGYAHAVPAGQLPDSSPLRKFDLRFVDEQGRTILSASDFTVKRIVRQTGGRPLKKNSRMYFQRQWHLLPVTDADQGNPWPHHLLVFDSEWDSKEDSDGDLFEDFSRSLTSHVTVVRPGTAFHREATDIFRINPASGDDYLSLCRILEQENRWPQGIVYRWPAMGAVHDRQRPYVALDQGVNALLLLSQALVAVDSRRAVRLLYIDSVEDGAARAAHDALGAFMGTLRQEHPSLQYKTIAVRLRPDESLTPKQVRAIAGNEFRTADEEYRLLYKDDLRYVGGYRAFRPAQRISDAPVFTPRGVYLITGGLGALGRSIARHLASACQARLVLVGRRGLQAADREWMATLEAGGAEVIYVQADISISDDVQAVVRRAGERFQTVNGVIHAAGLIRDAFVRNKTLADMQAVMAPKIQGTLNLDHALGDAPLDFFMLFSSISAVAGNVGQCDYAYANAFMDAYARQRERMRNQGRRHGKTLSINWPLWREGGMIIDGRIEKMLETSLGMTPLDTADGLALLEEGLASDETCYGVVDGDVLRLRQILGITDAQPPDEIPARGPEPAPSMGETMNERLAEDIRAMAGSILKVETEDVDIDESLAEYGFDSITFTELANTVNERYGVNVTPPVFFEHTAIESFAAYLMQTFPAEMQNHFTAAQPCTAQPYNDPVPLAAPDSGGALSVAGSRARSSDAPPAGENRSLLPAVMEELKQIVGRILKVPPDEIDIDESLAEYGFDSITFTELANTINERYGINVTPPVFFEHTAIESFAAYLMQTYSDAVGQDAAGPGVVAGQTAVERVQTVQLLGQPSDCAPYNPVGDRSGADESVSVEPPAIEEQANSHDVIFRPESKGVPPEPRGVLSGEPLAPAVAIIGMSGRLPGAENPDVFWQHLAAGRDLIREVPADRWDWRAIYGDPRQPGNKTNSKWGGFVDNVDCFDTDFFSISPLEAECMDPQHRIFLETVWQTIEDAGYNPDGLAGSNTGLFVGIGNFDYGLMYRERNIEIEPHAAVGLAHCMIANRISYLLDLHGPSEPVDTACSSSLVAIHRAVEAIRRGECQLAIAGGVNLMLLPTLHVAFGKSGMLSPDGRCKTFDRDADGYVRGEGVGAVLLKSLDRAVADKDHIYAVIRATSINHGGHASSLAAPNPKAQADLIVDAFDKAGIDPASVTYIEAHGTGTALGDPVEINGLKTAFRTLFDRRGQTPPTTPFCGIGSVKTNIGHLETAAGIASVLKVLLSFKHRTLPASLHLKALNPYIDLKDSPFYIVSEKRPWAALNDENGLPIPRRAGVSSFGFGGVNAHMVLEEYTPEEVDAGRGPDAAAVIPGEQLFVLSAGTRQQLKTYAERLADYLAGQQNRHEEAVCLRDIAFTLQTGRPALAERLAVVAGDVDRLIRGLETFARDRGLLKGVYCGRPPRKAPLSPATGQSGNTGTAPAAVVQGQSLDMLARRWVAGEALEWNGLYSGVAPGRVSLPTYPFERRSCWLPRTDRVPAAAAVVENKIPADDVPVADPAPAPGARDHALPSSRLVDRTTDYLAGVLARVTKQPVEKINPRAPFEHFGIDSLTTLKLTHELEKHFGKLSKTLFFEHGNIRELAAFLSIQYRTILERLFQMETDIAPAATTGPSDTAAPAGTASPAVQVEAPQPDQKATEGASAGIREDIAIVGLSGRYPGARNLDQFWENLCAGRDSITEIPPDRWELKGFFDPSPGTPGRSYCKWGGFIDDVDKFDPLFFNITPKEAEFMEPQERLFLQVAWEAFEDAGYTRAGLQGLQVGVFAGVMYGQYQLWEAEVDGRRVAPGSFFAAVANRVSYHFNLSGPSIALDTMCSSSLTAIHLACESIRRGESDMALCGGVNLSIHPNKYTFLSLGRFVSSDGRCRSFGRDGDGYVPGEGVGAVVLKPLRRALTDQDHIYGLIKGSALNHGGKTSGFSVPNPNAQGDLIRRAMARAGVHPRTVSYVEAHGTGTALGDPIEISGLEKCFGNVTAQKQYCPIGSVKSNIGHLEAAAGIAALTKVLLQMKHGVLVPSIHSRELNPNIDFSQSPFYVQRELTPWEHPHVAVDGRAREFPRRAGISAFGAGGANAHLIVEEFVDQEGASTSQPAAESHGPQLVVLSAATPEALDQVVDRLWAFLKRKDVDGEQAPHPVELHDLAYTLQVGREAQKERLAFIVSHTREFMERLEQYRNGTMSDLSGVFRKNGHAVVPEFDSLLTSQEGREFIHNLMNGGKLEALARLWIAGADIQWSRLYAAEKPRRIALPTYPFARERCWLAAPALPKDVPYAAPVADSLVLRNISTFQRECFETVFTGEGVWFTDHCIAGRKILPGAVFLEMARAAACLAGERQVAGFENVQWLKGIVSGDRDVSVLTCLHPTENGALFRIHTGIVEDERPPHARGELVFVPDGTQPPDRTVVDLSAIRRRCATQWSKERCYEMFGAAGITYGPAFQSIRTLLFNDAEALAHLELPRPWASFHQDWILHPALLDSAFQAVLGLLAPPWSAPQDVMVPVELKKLEIAAAIPSRCFAYVTWADSRQRPGDGLVFNVTMLDENGNVAVRMTRLHLRELKGELKDLAPAADRPQTALCRMAWENSDPFGDILGENLSQIAEALEDNILMVFDGPSDYTAGIRKTLASGSAMPRRIIRVLPGAAYQRQDEITWVVNPKSQADFMRLVEAQPSPPQAILFLWGLDPANDDAQAGLGRLDGGYYAALYLARSLMKHHGSIPLSLVFAYPRDDTAAFPEYAAMGGLAKTIRLEDPLFAFRTLALDPGNAGPSQACPILLRELTFHHDAPEVRYRNGRRQVNRLQPLMPSPVGSESISSNSSNTRRLLKSQGVYVIAGGGGGLGLILAEHLAQHYQARLVLAGRSAPDGRLEGVIASLEALGAKVLYVQADVVRAEDARNLIDETKARFGRVNGIIHGAGLLRDSLIFNKSLGDVRAVLAPKVDGVLNLDRACREEPLDFFVLFSSLAAVTGNVGQCDYAFANAFLDAFAIRREYLRGLGRRSGVSVSINWPLWQSGKMRANEQAKIFLEKTLGLVPMPSSQGLTAFEACLGAGRPQIIVIHGDTHKAVNTLNKRILAPDRAERRAVAGSPEDAVPEEIEAYLISELSREAKLPREKIDPAVSLEQYGIDSIIIMNMISRMETVFGELPKTLFYEYQTLRDLARYLAGHYPPRHALPGGPVSRTDRSYVPNAAQQESAAHAVRRFTAMRREKAVSWMRPQAGDIAIIGLAGRYPRSADPGALWANLCKGMDGISEVPAERWDHARYYDPDREREGKTYSKWGGFIDDIDKFDALFFNIAPREADLLDPQERLFLETAWALIEDAGYTRSRLAGYPTGVFVGVMWGQYQQMVQGAENTTTPPSSSFASIANRVSYFMNLQGPSMAVDTMCSSSLTAIHLAVDSIRKGESRMAIAGGVNLTVHPNKYLLLSRTGFLSSDGRCRSFGSGGDGYVPGEGVGAVLLKSLDHALADNDHIYAVIKSSVVNHGGRTNGYTVPNPGAQARVIRGALEAAGMDPRTITYIEAHGTGTVLGDPIEIAGLSQAFMSPQVSPKVSDDQTSAWCAIGSIKSNIGHLESAAGIAGLTKILLQMQHRRLVPSLHAETLNPNLALAKSPFKVQRHLTEWRPAVVDQQTYPLRAGLSSFGAGGSNAHLLVEAYTDRANRDRREPDEPRIIVLSAKTGERLLAYVRKFLRFLDDSTEPAPSLADLAYTLQIGREPMECRLALIALDMPFLQVKLEGFIQFLNATARTPAPREIYTNVTSADSRPSEPGPVSSEFFTKDDLGQVVADVLVRSRDLDKIAQAWVSGFDIDWTALYPDSDEDPAPRVISLPTYPFEPVRHWFSLPVAESRGELREPEPSPAPAQDHGPTPAQVRPGVIDSPQPEEVGDFIIHIISKELHIPKPQIDPRKDLKEYGLESIGALRLINQLNRRYGCEIPTEVLTRVSVLSLAAAVKGAGDAGSVAETAREPDGTEMFPEIRRMSPSLDIGTVMLNGATGVLGACLLKDILESTSCKVVCLVRAGEAGTAAERLRMFLKVYDPQGRLDDAFDARVIPMAGDITQPYLGLDRREYEALTGKVDLVIHNAAKTSLHGVYSELEEVNVRGTRTMIEFARATARQYLVFISSYTVFGDRVAQKTRPFTENDLDVGQGFEHLGYPRTKYEAERLVRAAHGQGLRWIIIRPGNIMGDSRTGAYPFGLARTPGIFYDLLKTVIDLKTAPLSPQLFDITPVDYVSRGIIHLCLERQEMFSTYHLLNPEPNSFEQIVGLLNRVGYPVTLIDRDAFLENIRTVRSDYHSLSAELMRFNPAFVPNRENTPVSCELTRSVLSPADIGCPSVDEQLLATYVDYCTRNSVLPPAPQPPTAEQYREPQDGIASTQMLIGG